MRAVRTSQNSKVTHLQPKQELKDIKAHAAESGDISLWVCGYKRHFSHYTQSFIYCL